MSELNLQFMKLYQKYLLEVLHIFIAVMYVHNIPVFPKYNVNIYFFFLIPTKPYNAVLMTSPVGFGPLSAI